jgi:hypothetical protein
MQENQGLQPASKLQRIDKFASRIAYFAYTWPLAVILGDRTENKT